MADAAPAARGAMGFLGSTIPGTPIPIWLVVVAGGVGAAFVLPKFLNRGTTDQTATNAGTPQADPTAGGQIDPYTGVPYSVENAINPQTGRPSYFDLFPPTSQGGSGTPPPPSPTTSCPEGQDLGYVNGRLVCKVRPPANPCPPGYALMPNPEGGMSCQVMGPPEFKPPNTPPVIRPGPIPGPIPRPLPNISQWGALNGMTGRQ